MQKRFGLGKKILLAALAAGTMLVVLGAAYQKTRDVAARKAYPPPGTIVTVDTLGLHLDCRGEGHPLVLLESGLTTGSTSWALVHDEIAKFTRVCAYDRPGIDWSDPIGRRVGPAEVAQRMHRLVEAAKLEGPWILVGMSAGGIYVREYFDAFPENVVGMVLVDSSHEEQGLRLPPTDADPLALAQALALCSYLQPLGVIRALGIADDTIDTFWQVEIPASAEGAIKANANQAHSCSATYYEMVSFDEALATPRKPRSLGDLPLIVISQGNQPQAIEELGLTRSQAIAQRNAWNELQEELASLSTRGERRMATQSGHLIQIEQPSIVIDSIRDMVRATRSARPSP